MSLSKYLNLDEKNLNNLLSGTTTKKKIRQLIQIVLVAKVMILFLTIILVQIFVIIVEQ